MTPPAKNPTTVHPGLLVALGAGLPALWHYRRRGRRWAGDQCDIKNGTVQSKDIREKTIKSHDLALQTAARVSGYQIVDESSTSYRTSRTAPSRGRAAAAGRSWASAGIGRPTTRWSRFVKADGREATADADNPSSADPHALHVRIICGKVSTVNAN